MKTARQKLIEKLDDFCRKKVKENANYVCERCGKSNVIMNWAHILGRGKRQVRWGFKMRDGNYCWNAFSLCVGCHWWFDNSTNRGEVDDWLESKLGRAKWMELKERARRTDEWGMYELRNKLEELESLQK